MRFEDLVFVVVFVLAVIALVVLAECVWVEDADEPVLESALSEVDDESEFEVRGAECCAECVAVSSGDIVVFRDDIEEESFFDEEVGADGADDFFVELDIDFVVGGVRDFFDFEFFNECFFVDLDRVTRSEFFVHFDRASDQATA